MKTGHGLTEYAIAQLGRPYWWGCFGQRADGALYAQKKKQYPAYYTAADFQSQYGQKVHDCVGLIKGYVRNYEHDQKCRKHRKLVQYGQSGCGKRSTGQNEQRPV